MPEKIGCKSDDIRPIPMYHTILEMGDDAESDEQMFHGKTFTFNFDQKFLIMTHCAALWLFCGEER